ncbi:HET-domain-containing [Fusarium acutatum]|uniref:HET-domain-containing n=1 Tax=Fusarium acutatum TaxID=78861 RepID=A0A8H4NFK8_9HYPO|nr:HET-domain-containing [Fusarium acutatum]
MKTYPLGMVPPYQALSYTWDSLERSDSIIINGVNWKISQSLWEALRHILSKARATVTGPWTGRMWVDGLCINQRDEDEKSSQVARMRDVYSTAARTIVWIGLQDESVAMAFDTLERFAADDGTVNGARARKELDQPERRRDAIGRLIQRQWFSRTWVIQEVVVAAIATVQCGQCIIEWQTLQHGLERATGSGFYPFGPQVANVTNIGNWRRDFLEMPPSAVRDEALDLRILTMDPSNKGATNPRDKIYALRGIASEAYARGISVNYRDPVEKVYVDCAKHLLRMRKDLRVLSLIRRHHRRATKSLSLPSWVPDWSQAMDGGGVLQRYYRFLPERMFRACSTSKSHVTISANNKAIRLAGTRLGTVIEVHSIQALILGDDCSTQDIQMSRARLIVMARTLGLPQVYQTTGEPSWLALFRTITADRTAFSSRIDAHYRMRNFSSVSSAELSQKSIDDAWNEISASLPAIFKDKVLFTTDEHLLGFTESGCRVGEDVCVFLGGEVPFMIQKMPEGHYHLHGEAYLHGMMDGEALARHELGELDLDYFEIQ